MKFRPNSLKSPRRNGAPTHGIRTPPTPKQIPVPETSGALGDSPSQATSSAFTTEELISRAKHHIGIGEQRLAEQWSPNPFRDLLMDSPKAAQERFLRDVLLLELSGWKAVSSLPAGEGGGR